jgi:hypothetical protein
MDGTGDHHLKWSYPGSEGQKPHCFLLYVEYRPNTNTVILWKTGHAMGRSPYKEGTVKEGS